MNLVDLARGWTEGEGENKVVFPFKWDDVLPWEWHHVFNVFPPEVLEIIVRALCYKADKWIDGYFSIYSSAYPKNRHPELLPEDRFYVRERIISLMMYGITWVDFDVYCTGFLKHLPKSEGGIKDFLTKFFPIRQSTQKFADKFVQVRMEKPSNAG